MAADSVDDLIGLWEAKLRFGPDIKGRLTIEWRNGGWSADIAGHTADVAIGTDISFSLAGGAGAFRGRLNAPADAIDGHWIQARATSNGTTYATPVHLVRQAEGRFEGSVAPLDDTMTLYLMVGKGADGRTTAFLRNPERNVGVFVNLTRLTRDGDVVRLFGQRSQEEREVASGSYDSENGVLRFAFPFVDGTFDFKRAAASSAFYPRGAAPAHYTYRAPPSRDDGWPVGTLDDAGISRAGIEAFVQMLADMKIDSVHASDIHGFLLARHGKLVAEEYFHGFHRDLLHDTRSAAKSMTSVLAGAVAQAGFPLGVSTLVYAAMADGAAPDGLEPRKQAMTVEHLLTMSSGFHCDDADSSAPGNEDVMQEQTTEPDWYRYALALPMVSDPGAVAVYCSVNANLLGGVINRVTREPLTDLFARLVARPLQIERYALNLTPTGEAYMGGGVRLTLRDFAKFGQLLLNRGVWNGRRIVSEEWVARATSPLYELGGVHYGYLWWSVDLPYKGRTVRAVYAGGNGGQVVVTIAELDLVIAFNGGNYSDRVFFVPQRVYVPEIILPTVNE